MTGTDWDPDETVGESLREVRRNIESMDRTFWRYGVPALVLALLVSGFAFGFFVGVSVA